MSGSLTRLSVGWRAGAPISSPADISTHAPRAIRIVPWPSEVRLGFQGRTFGSAVKDPATGSVPAPLAGAIFYEDGLPVTIDGLALQGIAVVPDAVGIVPEVCLLGFDEESGQPWVPDVDLRIEMTCEMRA